jgi:hypothetical protein
LSEASDIGDFAHCEKQAIDLAQPGSACSQSHGFCAQSATTATESGEYTAATANCAGASTMTNIMSAHRRRRTRIRWTGDCIAGGVRSSDRFVNSRIWHSRTRFWQMIRKNALAIGNAVMNDDHLRQSHKRVPVQKSMARMGFELLAFGLWACLTIHKPIPAISRHFQLLELPISKIRSGAGRMLWPQVDGYRDIF